MWKYCRYMDIPETLAYKTQFRGSGRVVKYGSDLLRRPIGLPCSWVRRYGRNATIRWWICATSRMSDQSEGMRETMRRAAEAAPLHEDYIAQHCHSDVVHG